MTVKQLPHYIRRHRKRVGLSQEEMAFLLGCQSSAKISRYENFSRTPNLKTAFLLSLVLNIPLPDLFVGFFQETEQDLLKRIEVLRNHLQRQEQKKVVLLKSSHLSALLEHIPNPIQSA